MQGAANVSVYHAGSGVNGSDVLLVSVQAALADGTVTVLIPSACSLDRLARSLSALPCVQQVGAPDAGYGSAITTGFYVRVRAAADGRSLGSSPTFTLQRRPWAMTVDTPAAGAVYETGSDILIAGMTNGVTGNMSVNLYYQPLTGAPLLVSVLKPSVAVAVGAGYVRLPSSRDMGGGYGFENTTRFFVRAWSLEDTTMLADSALFTVYQVPVRATGPAEPVTVYTGESLQVRFKAVDLDEIRSRVYLYLVYPAPAPGVEARYVIVRLLGYAAPATDGSFTVDRLPPGKVLGEAYAITKTSGFRVWAVTDAAAWFMPLIGGLSADVLAKVTVQELPGPLRTVTTVQLPTGEVNVDRDGYSSISPANITVLRPNITVLTPAAGAHLFTGGVARVTWTAFHLHGTLSLYLYYFTAHGATLVTTIAAGVPVSQSVESPSTPVVRGSYEWALPTAAALGSGFALTQTNKFYVVAVADDDGTVRGTSALYTTITEPPALSIAVTSPAAGTVTRIGSAAAVPITWTSVGIGSEVTLALYYAGWGRNELVMTLDASHGLGAQVILSAEGATRVSTANWTLPAGFPQPALAPTGSLQEYGTTFSAYFFVRVTSKDVPAVQSNSPPYFVVLGAARTSEFVRVSRPESGSTFTVNNPSAAAVIRAEYEVSPGLRIGSASVFLMYAGYFGTSRVADMSGACQSTGQSTGSCRWTVPTNLALWGSKYTTNFFVAVTAQPLNNNPAVTGTSSPYFYILPPRRYINVNTPAANKVVVAGNTVRIAWTVLSSVTRPLDLSLYCVDPTAPDGNPNVNITAIAAGVPAAAGTFDWTVPTSVLSRPACMGFFVSVVGVADDAQQRVSGESDGLFSIVTAVPTAVPGWQLTLLFTGFAPTSLYNAPDLDNIFKTTIAGMFELPALWVTFSSFGAVTCSAVVNSTCADQTALGTLVARRRALVDDSARVAGAVAGTSSGAPPVERAQAAASPADRRGLQGSAGTFLSVSLEVRVPPSQWDFSRKRIDGFVALPNTDPTKVVAFQQLAARLDDALGLSPGTVDVAAVSSAAAAPLPIDVDDGSALRAPAAGPTSTNAPAVGGGVGGTLAVLLVAAAAYYCWTRGLFTREQARGVVTQARAALAKYVPAMARGAPPKDAGALATEPAPTFHVNNVYAHAVNVAEAKAPGSAAT